MTTEEVTPQSTIETMERHKEEAGVAFLGWVQFTADEYYIVKEALEKRISKRVFANSKREFTNDDFKGFAGCRYYCPNCKEQVQHYVKFCNKCGQKLLFPTFTFSEYKHGERQTRTMTWEDDK